MDPSILSLIQTVGVPGVALIVFAQWVKGYVQRHEDAAQKREGALSERLTKLEDYQREQLTGLVKDANSALREWTHSLTNLVRTIPCLMRDEEHNRN